MATKKEYADIKAGVEGLVGDAPAPPTLEEAPEAPAPAVTTTMQEEEQEPALTSETAYAETALQNPSRQEVESAPMDIERVHAIIEAVVTEKWEDLISKVGDITTWKERTNMNVLSIKQELLRTNERFTNLQNAVLGRVKTYDQGIQDIHTEMKALERVFERIVEPLVSNIKELNRITQELKRIKK